MKIPFYPKTHHLPFSKERERLDIADKKDFIILEGKKVVIEEKVDAQAIGVFFEHELLHLLFRGQYFCPDRKQELPKELKNCYAYFKSNEELFYEVIQDNKIMYGEWMEYLHTVQYDKLPSLFLEYDIYCKEKEVFLSTIKRQELLRPFPEINSVFVHKTLEPFNYSDFINTINNNKLSQYGDNIHHEGFYIKIEDENQVLERFKWIEPIFFNDVIESEHWKKRELKKNKLK